MGPCKKKLFKRGEGFELKAPPPRSASVLTPLLRNSLYFAEDTIWEKIKYLYINSFHNWC